MQGTTHRLGGIACGALVSAVAVHTMELSSPILTTGIIMTGAGIGSLIPDIDHEGSLIGRKMKHISHVVRKTCGHRGWTHTLLGLFIYGLCSYILSSLAVKEFSENAIYDYIGLFILTFAVLDCTLMFVVDSMPGKFTRKMKQRTHLSALIGSIVLATIFKSFTVNLIPLYLIGGFIGYVSHLLLDMLTVSGVPLLKGLPVSKKIRDKQYRLMHLTTGKTEGPVSVICCIFALIGIILVIA